MSAPSEAIAWAGATREESETVEALLQSLDRFASAEIRAGEIDRAHTIDRRILSGLAELGLFGLSIPERLGGAELSLAAICRVIARLAAHDRSVATTLGLHLGLGTRGLVAFGGSAVQERYLPRLATGEAIAAFAATEAEAGSDLSAIKTTLLAREDQLRLNGEKIFVTNAHLASVVTVTAASPGLGGAKKGHSMIAVEPGDRGVELGREEEKLGLRGSSTATLRFEEVELPAERLIGEPGRGMTQLHHALAWGRTLMAAGCAGAARKALQLALQHIATRRQFGRPLAELEVVKEELADLAARRFAVDALVQHAALSPSDEALARRSTSAKIFASESSWHLADRAVQLFGGSGFIEESGVPLLLRDTRVSRIFEGANDVLRIHLGTMCALEPAARLAPEVAKARAEHGIRLMRRQLDLHRLGSATVLADAMEAARLRAKAEGTPLAEALAERFCARAELEIRGLLGAEANEHTALITEALYEGEVTLR